MSNPDSPSKSKVQDWHVWVDRDLCIGAGSCIAIAPQTFALDDAGKAILLDTSTTDEKSVVLDAAQACPVAAIYIEEIKTGKRIFPS